MAKTKDAQSRGGENRYNPPTDARQRTTYNKKWLKARAIVEGRIISLEAFPEITDKLFQRNLASFVLINGQIYPELIREFYANYRFNTETKMVRFHLNKKWWEFPLNTFGEILGVPTEGMEFYSRRHKLEHLSEFIQDTDALTLLCKPNANHSEILSKGLTGKDLRSYLDILNKIIDHNIYCRLGNYSHIHVTQIYVMWAIELNMEINVAFLMASQMSNLMTESTRSLPYGMHLNNLFSYLKVTHAIVQQPSFEPLDKSIIIRSDHLIESSRGRRSSLQEDLDEIENYQPEEESDEEEIEDEEANLQEHQEFVNSNFETKIDRILKQEEEIRENHSRFKKALKGFVKTISCSRS
ncbi:uncharacterized protein [Rutidosis leptorrhynchoides]|uniref:uncharacterized protein isoform X1 n=1 Tax=Rutidosis leptorrhynchoides TaxID=125765 RepID=UPI003A99902D